MGEHDPSVFSSPGYWAKLKREGDGQTSGEIVAWHPLVAHSAEVAAVLELLLRETSLGSRMARLHRTDANGEEALPEPLVQRLCVLAVLHDAGKTNPWFQSRATGEGRTTDHISPVLNMLWSEERWAALSSAMDLEPLYPWFGGPWETMDWLQVTWSHHGRPVEIEQPPKNLWPEGTLERLAEPMRWARQWYPQAFEERLEPSGQPSGDASGDASGHGPVLEATGLQHLFIGGLTLADWIGSDTSIFELTSEAASPASAMERAKQRAEDAAGDLGLVPPRSLDSSLTSVLGGHEPYDIQQAVQSLPAPPEGTLTVLESATGSGKTEAALGRYAYLLEEELVDSMYFAVPTRAAAKQLQKRIQEARDRIFDGEGPPVHLAVPGYLKVDDVEGTRLGWQVRWDEEVGPRGWAAESSKRYTASPIAVGTVDQALLSALQTSHAHLRLAGLSRSFLVVDEVHASSVYMNELLRRVLSLHRKAGGHALLMSATLGSKARADFTGGPVPSLKDAKEKGYPMINHVSAPASGAQPDAQTPDAQTSQSRTSRVQKCPGAPGGNEKEVSFGLRGWAERPERIAQRAEQAAASGAHVLVIRNTVRACQNLFEEVSDQYLLHLKLEEEETPAPHHSRYCAADRELLDHRVEEAYGKESGGEGSERASGGLVTVATQTVEQSLDIDADLLITDLCPMDVLLQRIGRLHRHDRPRPTEHSDPHCTVLTPESRDIVASIDENSGKGYPGPGLGSVYSDLRVIEATWEALKARATAEDPPEGSVSIPKENRPLVEDATHPSVLSEIASRPGWEAHAQKVQERAREEALEAQNNLIDWDQRPIADENRFPGERLKTRLGDDGVVVALPDEMETPFGKHVQELTLSPYHFGRKNRPENGAASHVEPAGRGFVFEFGGKTFEYDRKGIQKR